MKNKQTIALLGLLALVTASSQSQTQAATEAPATTKADKLFDDPVIAKGKDFDIKRSQLDEAFVNARATAAAAGVTFNDSERATLELRLLNELIVGKVLSAKATDEDKQRAREAAEKFIVEAKKQFSSEEAFNAKLKLNKLTLEELRAKLIKEALPSSVLEREMKGRITITDAQVKKFYDENPSKFEQPEMVRASHILIGTKDANTGAELTADQKAAKRKQAEDLLKRVKAGEDFAKLAKQYSEDPGSRDNGGEYTFPRGQMVPPFEAAAFALKKSGDLSDIVTTDFGFHIIKLGEKKAARTVPFTEVSDRIKEFLLQQEAAKITPAYFEKLKTEAGVEILDEQLKKSEAEAKSKADVAK